MFWNFFPTLKGRIISVPIVGMSPAILYLCACSRDDCVCAPMGRSPLHISVPPYMGGLQYEGLPMPPQLTAVRMSSGTAVTAILQQASKSLSGGKWRTWIFAVIEMTGGAPLSSDGGRIAVGGKLADAALQGGFGGNRHRETLGIVGRPEAAVLVAPHVVIG